MWSSEALLLYFRAAHLLKDGSKLPVAINLLSAAAAAECRASISREQLLPADASRWPVSGRCGPGRSTLRRLAFAVDVAAMMLEKRIRARLPSQATYGWADSSPQGQRDWLLSKTCVLRADSDIAALFRAANALAISRSASSEAEGAAAEGLAAGSRRRRRVLDDSSSSSDSQAGPVVAAQGERRLHVEMLRLAFFARVLPPVAMGLRQTSLAHKCAAFTHSVALESPASLDSLHAELDSYVSFTTDLGTEVAMPDFRLGCLSSLMPEWLRQPYEQLEADCDGSQVDSTEADEQQPPQPPPPPSPPPPPPPPQQPLELDGADSSYYHCDEAASLAVDDGIQEFEAKGSDADSSSGTVDKIMQLLAHATQPAEQLEPDYGEMFSTAQLPARAANTQLPARTAAEPRSRLREKAAATISAEGTPLMPNAIPVPGMLHVLNNMLADVDTSLAHWEQFHGQLSNVCALLSDRMRLERFAALCVASSDIAAVSAAAFEVPLPRIYDKRWGSTTGFMKKAWPLMPMLRAAWDPELYADGDGEVGCVFFSGEIMTQTLADDLFFVYGEAMLLLHDVVLELTCWSEGCVCHPLAERGHGRSHRSWKRLDASRREELGGRACPMEGRRAPELAAGALRDMLSQLGSLKLGALACTQRRHLSDEQWRAVVTDFEHGRAHMQTLLAIKLSAWDRLPWLLCGLAHHDEGVARSCAERAAALFDSTPAAASHLHHNVTLAFLSREAWPGGRAPAGAAERDSPGDAVSWRKDLDEFASGESLVNLSPVFLSAVAKLKFIPVVERDMEAKHKDIKHVLASLTRHSAARVSLAVEEISCGQHSRSWALR